MIMCAGCSMIVSAASHGLVFHDHSYRRYPPLCWPELILISPGPDNETSQSYNESVKAGFITCPDGDAEHSSALTTEGNGTVTTLQAIETMSALGIPMARAAEIAATAERFGTEHATVSTAGERTVHVSLTRHATGWNFEVASFGPEHSCSTECAR